MEKLDYTLIAEQLVEYWDRDCRHQKQRVVDLAWREVYNGECFPTVNAQVEALKTIAEYGPNELLEVTRDEFFSINQMSQTQIKLIAKARRIARNYLP